MIEHTNSTCFAETKKLLYSTKCTVFNNGVDLCTSFSVFALKQVSTPVPPLLIGLGGALRLVLGDARSGTAGLLALVLRLLECLPAPLLLLGESLPHESVLGLELQKGVLVVVDDAEAGRLATAELGAEAEEHNELGVGLVHAADDALELGLGDVRATGVDDVDDHLRRRRERWG